LSESSISTQRAVTIRELLPSDLDGALELWSRSDGIGLNESDSRDALLRFLARNPGLSAVALDAAQIVGAVLCGHDGRRGTIHHLAIAPAYRRRGIGSSLLEYSLSRLREASIPRCNLFLYDDNEDGRLFWTHHGWHAASTWKTWQRRL
jgi:ribosomal protein S18 acetylase RimI-like enzyme